MPAAGQPLTHCPICRYDLTGLPKNHRCPECGFEYDETMMVWNVPILRWWVWLSHGFMMVVWTFVMLVNLWRFVTGRGTPDWFQITTGICIPLSVIPSFMAFRRGATIILGRECIVLRVPFRDARSISWNDLTFTVPGRLPQWRVARTWLRSFALPTYGMSGPDQQHLNFQMHNRWKRYHENQPAADRPPGPATTV